MEMTHSGVPMVVSHTDFVSPADKFLHTDFIEMDSVKKENMKHTRLRVLLTQWATKKKRGGIPFLFTKKTGDLTISKKKKVV